MLKYESTLVTFTEVPDEIALCFNLSLCPCHCQDCFEPWLADDIGSELTTAVLVSQIASHKHISCICFMGGDNDHQALIDLCIFLHLRYPKLKLAMYSGLEHWDNNLADNLDYYKIGPYKPQYGPMNKKTTNQHFYKKENNNWIDITYRFQEKRA